MKDASDVITLQAPWQEVDVAIIGDSHALHLLQGLVYSSEQHKYALIWLPGELPLLDIVNPDSNMGFRERELMQRKLKIYQQMIRLTGENRSIKTIILAHYPKLSQIRELVDLLNPSEKDRMIILQDGLKRTLDYFKQKGKKVIVVADNPAFSDIIDRKINVCNPLRPFNSKNAKYCSMTKDIWNEKKQQYPFNKALALVLGSMSSSHHVKIVDLTSNFCNEEKCSLADQKMMYYKDSNHLSLSGSIKVAPHILEAIEK